MKNRDWKEVTITEVCTLIADCVNRTAPVVDYETEYKMIRTSNIKNGKIDYSDVKYVTSETFEHWNRRAIPRKDDVILTREAPYGEVGINNGKDKIFLGQRLMLYRADEKKCNPHFLYYSFLSDFCQNQFHKYASGSTVQHIKVPDAKKILIKLPPLPTQQKIADTLGAYDELIENNRRRIALLENMAAGLYKEWFVRMRPHGQTLPKNAETGLPEGWEVVSLFDVANVTYGFPFQSSLFNEEGKGRPLIRIRDILDSQTKTFTEEDAPEKYLVRSGDILIGMDGEFHIQKWSGTESYLNQRVVRLRPVNFSFSKDYLIRSVQEEIIKLNSIIVGTTVAHLGDKDLKKLKILNPPLSLMKEYKDLADSIYEFQIQLQEQTGVLRRMRDRLLPRLMSGELGE